MPGRGPAAALARTFPKGARQPRVQLIRLQQRGRDLEQPGEQKDQIHPAVVPPEPSRHRAHQSDLESRDLRFSDKSLDQSWFGVGRPCRNGAM
jgi:hypothetical protein